MRISDWSSDVCSSDLSEGMALLSLAEAFLRVPDPETADQLISDKIGEGDWRAHSGKSNSLLVNSATWGLLIGRAMVEDEQGSTVLRRLINRTGERFFRSGVGARLEGRGVGRWRWSRGQTRG